MGVPSHHPTLWDLALRPTDKKGNKYFLYKHTHTHPYTYTYSYLPTPMAEECLSYGRRPFARRTLGRTPGDRREGRTSAFIREESPVLET